MKQFREKRTVARTLLLVIGVGLIGAVFGGCTVSHPAMRGSVVAILDGEAHICIGSHDGLRVGDTLAVYRTRQVGFPTVPYGPEWSSGEIERSYRYEKTKVGKVRVIRIFDEHFAAVEVLAGEVDYPDIVERSFGP
ncbi:MAG TPA: hypothetical protein VGB89_09175 [Bacteroidota bacterium]